MLYLIIGFMLNSAVLQTEMAKNVVTMDSIPIGSEIGDILVYTENGLETAFYYVDNKYIPSFTDTAVDWDWEPLVIKASRLTDLPIDSEFTWW